LRPSNRRWFRLKFGQPASSAAFFAFSRSLAAFRSAAFALARPARKSARLSGEMLLELAMLNLPQIDVA
jgi:hypothetical protein